MQAYRLDDCRLDCGLCNVDFETLNLCRCCLVTINLTLGFLFPFARSKVTELPNRSLSEALPTF
eukprot:jgi/Psemu1/260692/estExt_Genewise1Plus.C_4850017